MAEFKDQDAAALAMDRIRALVQLTRADDVLQLVQDSPDPDRALMHLESWLGATANPSAQIEHLLDSGKMARFLILVLSASQSLANALTQSPELAAVLLDPAMLARPAKREDVETEGRQMIAVAESTLYSMDRLRYLRHKWVLPIVANDLCGTWEQSDVWLALSELADAIIVLTQEVSWKQYADQKGLDGVCPVSIAAFGKLGGQEINYSSDVDLVYVAECALDDEMEKHASRFCEIFGKALSEKMGRGSLYRVDLRLRPFGGTGPLVQSQAAVEAYYRSYAEVWESQALIKSRPITGSASFREWWENLRNRHCFRPQWSSAALEEIISARGRMESSTSPSDLKRGAGGIRDVEFLAQMLQLVHGHSHPELRSPNTGQVLSALSRLGLMPAEEIRILGDGYKMLRMAEHRRQMDDDRHTHELPTEPRARERFALLMNFKNWTDASTALQSRRGEIRGIYEKWVASKAASDSKDLALSRIGEHAELCKNWLDALPESAEFYRSIADQPESADLALKLLSNAPALVPYLRDSLALTEELLSGELQDSDLETVGAHVEEVPNDAPIERIASATRSEWLHAAMRWMLDPQETLGATLTRLSDAVILKVMRHVGAQFDVVALGSYATAEQSLASDCDLLFLAEDQERHAEAETQAEQVLSLLDELKRLGSPISVDLRLRPQGRQGLLVRTYSGFRSYDLGEMEMWERFALGESRCVIGNPMSEAVALTSAYALPLTPERLDELLAMKKRIETERVPAKYRHRNVKLGHGGLSDISWFVHLHELRYPTATQAGTRRDMPGRIRSLGHARLIHTLEQEALLRARTQLLKTRDRLFLLGLTKDIMPENPDRLQRLARASGFSDGNAFLAEHEDAVHSVRSIYEEGIERLRS